MSGKQIKVFKFISKYDADKNVVVDIIENNNGLFGPTSKSDVMKGNIKEATEVLEDIAKILGVGVTVGERKYAGEN